MAVKNRRLLLYKSVLICLVRYILFAFLLFVQSIVSAQPKVTFGKTYHAFAPSELPTEENKFFLQKDSLIVGVKISGHFVCLENLDPKNLRLSKLHLYQDFPKNFVVEKVAKYHGKYWMFYHSIDVKTGNEKLYCREINMETAMFAEEARILIDLKEPLKNLKSKHHFVFRVSSSGNKLLISYFFKPVKDKEQFYQMVLGFSIFNGNLISLINEKITMGDNEQDVESCDFHVDRHGNVYLLANIFDVKLRGKVNYPRDKYTFHYELTTIPYKPVATPMSTCMISDSSTAGIGLIQRGRLFETYTGEMVFTGFYGKKDGADGILTMKIGENGEKGVVKKTVIPEEIKKMYSEANPLSDNRMYEKDADEFSQMVITELFPESDRSFILVGEQQYLDIKPAGRLSYNSRHSPVVYHFNDLLVCKFDSSFNLLWMRKIPKSQMCYNYASVMSYKRLYIGGRHFFLMVENENNKHPENGLCPVNCTEETAVMLSVWILEDATGISRKIPLMEVKNILGMAAYSIYPGKIFALSDRELVTELSKKDDDQLVKIEFGP